MLYVISEIQSKQYEFYKQMDYSQMIKSKSLFRINELIIKLLLLQRVSFIFLYKINIFISNLIQTFNFMISNPYGLPELNSKFKSAKSNRSINKSQLFGSRVGLSTNYISQPNQFQSQMAYNNQIRSNAPISGGSRIEYIPYQSKYIDYETKQYVQKVPVERIVIDYREVKKIDYVPKQRTVTDYYAIQYQTNYVAQTVPEKVVQYVPVQKVTERIEYIPVEKQVIHYPDEALRRSRSSQVLNPGLIRNSRFGSSKNLHNIQVMNRPSSNIGQTINLSTTINGNNQGLFTTSLTNQYARPTSNYTSQIGSKNEINLGFNLYQMGGQVKSYPLRPTVNSYDTNTSTKILQKNQLTKSNNQFDQYHHNIYR